ncbi:carbohydrate ABC transporter permease [Paenibacillus sp. MMS20-IR301]|uniref:carbohydrate ABC transporter permease n=1 Tax=Paenibacillus sp. MMS20-IR301 TaxID=2895946 RepID=UPI0028ED7EBE|nr:carbohydrate ABC transporter permease [Paenibacillus sp. MMS20-IR301]WNS42884.1 carbohydrate ABC transporter permease [Paenibacillus sp. MMS20-IR301]
MEETNYTASSKIINYLILACLAVLFLIPIYFIVMTALKSNADLAKYPVYAFPEKLQWSNFSQAWAKMSIYIRNSMFISAVKVPIGILLEALAAYALTRMNFRWGNVLFGFFLIGMMVPFQATLVPLNMMINFFGLENTYPGVFIIYIGFGVPFGIMVLRGFLRSIPKELDESAFIDGCGELGKFFRIIVPIAMPAIATLIILDFLATWNEFLLAQIFITKDSMQPVTAGLLTFQGQHSSNYTLLSAAVLLSIIPILAVYLFFQKYFVAGMAGAVKG